MSRRYDYPRDCTHLSTIRGALLLLLLAGLSLGPPATAADGPCAAAEPLPPDATVQREAGAPGDDLYELALGEPGVLGLHVSAPIAAGSRPRLALLAADCVSPADGAGWVRVRETPRGLVLRIREAASLFLKVSPEDPDLPLAGYTLRSTFAAERAVPDEVVRLAADPPAACSGANVPTFTPEPLSESRFVVVERPPGLMKDVDPWEDDEVSGLVAEPGVIVVEGDGTPFDVSIHRDSGCGMKSRLAEGTIDGTGGFVAAVVHVGEQRLVVEGATAAAGYDLYVRFFALCAADTDHDRPLCSAPLAAGDVASGTIDDATDDDYYTFTLDNQTTVAVEVGGGEGVRGVLYDGGGQRLETWAGSLVRTLGDGTFYVRVGSVDGWVGEYAVGVELIP